jgi:hypothetical protein
MASKTEDELLQMLTQVAIFRFLIEERMIDRDRLVRSLEKRGQVWGKTASDEALLPLVALVTALGSDEEPEFPTTFH